MGGFGQGEAKDSSKLADRKQYADTMPDEN